MNPVPKVGDLNHLTLSVSDLDRSVGFYRDVLGLKLLAGWHRGAYLLAGESTWICLALEDTVEARTDYTHVAFTVAGERFDDLCRRVRESGAREWKANTSEGLSAYFTDPDGHRFELHVGDWRSRLSACRKAPYAGMVFHDDEKAE